MTRLSALGLGLALLLLLAPGPLRAEPDPPVRIIRVVGNLALSAAEIERVMETKTRGWRVWAKRPVLDRSALARDEEAIAQLYHNNGYYRVKVETEVDEAEGLITVKVTEGEPVRIRTVNLDLLGFEPGHLEGLRRIIEAGGLVTGQVFRLVGLNKVKADLVRYLAERARPRPELKAQASVSAGQGWADVELRLAPGPLMTMGPVSVEGLVRTKEAVLAKEVPWKGGEPFDIHLLQDLRRRLIDLGVFTSVRVEPDLARFNGQAVADGTPAPVKVTVVERKGRSVEFGVGYGTEDHFRVRGLYSLRSSLGLAEVFSLGAHYSSRTWGGETGYVQPHFLLPKQTLRLNLAHVDETDVSFSNTRTAATFGLERPVLGRLTVGLGYLVEIDRPYGIGVSHDPEENKRRFVSALRAQVGLDTRDDHLDPNRGSFILARGEAAPDWLGSELGYLRFEAGARHYQPLNSWLTLSGRVKWAAISALDPSTDVPIYKRLFSGGATSVRGYPFEKLGPLDTNGLPLGGKTLLEAGLEARFPLWGPLFGVVFTEAGNLNRDSWTLDLSDFRYTTGVGLRFKTPIGPLSLDLGYQLNPPPEANFRRFQFHLNIGQTF
jgi:outer membrane protein insertion porin family/translocation and assembly module TamA